MFDFSTLWDVFSPLMLLCMFAGAFGGLVVGVIPGLTSTMAVALLVPMTYGMPIELGIALLVAVYLGSITGGLVPAVLLNIPGTPSSVATTFDAYPMAQQGKAGAALAYGVFSSFLGSIAGFVAMVLLAPTLGKFALHFGPYENFALVVFALTCIISLSHKSLVKGVLSGTLGMVLACVGLSNTDSVSRFTFGISELQAGFAVMPVLIGMYALSQVLDEVRHVRTPFVILDARFNLRDFLQVARNVLRSYKNYIWSSCIGVGIGILPGVGPNVANILAYVQARNRSAAPDSFGKGNPEGIIAAESANNASTGGAMIPLLTLGIPGDATTMMMLGCFMIHGVQPGPLLFQDNGNLVLLIFAAYFISNIMVLIIQTQFIGVLIRSLLIPRYILYPVILAMCVVGTFALNNNLFDAWVFLGMGVVGYVFTRLEFPLLPLLLGLILGRLAETELRVSMVMHNDSLMGFLDRPIALFFLAAALFSICLSLRNMYRRRHAQLS